MKWKILVLALVVCVLIYLYLFTAFINNKISPSLLYQHQQSIIINDGFNHEWAIIDENIFIRRSGVFYSPNDSLISILLLSRKNHVQNIKSCLININGNAVVEIKRQYIRKLLKLADSIAYRVDYNFRLNDHLIRNTDTTVSLNKIDLQLYLVDKNGSLLSKDGLNVKILSYSKAPNKVAICSKMYNLTENNFESFKLWIQLNRLMGYDKLVIYNNSIPSNENYIGLLRSHSDFVVLKQYSTIPNLKSNYNNTLLYYNNLKFLNRDELYLNERLVINECFLENRLLYDYIVVLDYDELIVPSNSRNIKEYIGNLNQEYSTNKNKSSFWFRYVLFIETETIIKNFKNFNKSDKNLYFEYADGKSITFTNNNETHLEYLLKSIDALTKSGKLLKDDHLFNRVFMLYEKRNYQFGFGKSVHKTKHPLHIGHHEAMRQHLNSHHVGYKHGYVSHFRSRLNKLSGNFDITNLHIDWNYINNYFAKKFNNVDA